MKPWRMNAAKVHKVRRRNMVTIEEFEMDRNLVRLENEDKKEDAQRMMAWFALFGMLLYPTLVVVSVLFGIAKAANILGDIA